LSTPIIHMLSFNWTKRYMAPNKRPDSGTCSSQKSSYLWDFEYLRQTRLWTCATILSSPSTLTIFSSLVLWFDSLMQCCHLGTLSSHWNCRQRRSQTLSRSQSRHKSPSASHINRSTWLYRSITRKVQNDQSEIGVVSWSTHKQSTVAFSSMESEYMALSDVAQEALARNSSFVNCESHLAKNPSQYCQTVNPRLTSLRISPNIERPSTSIFNIMQFVTTFRTPRLKSTTFPQNRPIFSQKRAGQRSINGFRIWSVCATATKHFNLRRFFSEYAIQRRVSHNHMQRASIGIYKRFFLPQVSFSFFNPGNVGWNGACYYI
jgi:hypothetical protein